MDWLQPTRDCAIAAAGAGAGTYAAFQLERQHRARERRDADVVAGNLALVTLAHMLSRILNLKQHTSEIENFEVPWMARPAQLDPDDSPHIELASLAFLLLQKRRGVLSDIEQFSRYFRAAEHRARERARFGETMLQPELERVRHSPAGAMNPHLDSLGRAVSERIRVTMQAATADLIKVVDDAVHSGTELLANLRAAIQEAYPTADLVPIGPAGSEVTPKPL
jgi:hypothetical protein